MTRPVSGSVCNCLAASCFLHYRSDAARRFANRFLSCVAGAAAQAPLGLNADCTTAFMSRMLERQGSRIGTPSGASLSHPTQPAVGGVPSAPGHAPLRIRRRPASSAPRKRQALLSIHAVARRVAPQTHERFQEVAPVSVPGKPPVRPFASRPVFEACSRYGRGAPGFSTIAPALPGRPPRPCVAETAHGGAAVPRPIPGETAGRAGPVSRWKRGRRWP